MTDTAEILAEREKTHGAYPITANISQTIKRVVRDNHPDMPDEMLESLDMIASKVGRICSGNAFTKDHWVDIAGYAALIVKALETVKDAATTDDPS